MIIDVLVTVGESLLFSRVLQYSLFTYDAIPSRVLYFQMRSVIHNLVPSSGHVSGSGRPTTVCFRFFNRFLRK